MSCKLEFEMHQSILIGGSPAARPIESDRWGEFGIEYFLCPESSIWREGFGNRHRECGGISQAIYQCQLGIYLIVPPTVSG